MDVIGKRKALGRGLGALIPGAPAPQEPAAETFVPLAAIRPNPMQPRQTFAEIGMDELARSVREKGILQPLLVRRTHLGFELIAGERRLRAAQQIGLEQVPVIVRAVADDELLELALIENIQREDLNPLEEAHAYRRLIDELHLTQEDIARRVGKDRSTIANALRLLQLPEEVKGQIERGALSAGHARALAGAASDTERLTIAREVVAKRLSVRQTEQLARRSARPTPDAEQRAVAERLTQLLGTRVRLTSGRGGAGKIEIEYYSLEELNGLIDRLSSAQAAA